MELCEWQTGYGLPWDETCGQERAPGRPYCPEHMRDLVDDYGGKAGGVTYAR